MHKLSLIVPIYNEEQGLERVLTYLFESPCPIEREWILIDDGSTDRTVEILEKVKSRYPFLLIKQEKNAGKGAAVRAGLAHATGSLVMIQDADFEYDPKDIPSLLQPFLEDRADVVYGSRFKKSSLQVHRTYHYFVNRFLTTLSNILSGVYLTDMETCYKIFKADLIQSMNLRSNRFGIEVELTAYLAKTSARLFELPIYYYPRAYLQGKKINWKDGVAALFHLVRFNWFVGIEEAFHDLPWAYTPKGLKANNERAAN